MFGFVNENGLESVFHERKLEMPFLFPDWLVGMLYRLIDMLVLKGIKFEDQAFVVVNS